MVSAFGLQRAKTCAVDRILNYTFQFSDIIDSPCNEISITVSGYNGLDGETKPYIRYNNNLYVGSIKCFTGGHK